MTLAQKLGYMANSSIAQDEKYTLPVWAAASRRGVGRSVISKACLNGELDAIKRDGKWLINEASFKQWRPAWIGRKRT